MPLQSQGSPLATFRACFRTVSLIPDGGSARPNLPDTRTCFTAVTKRKRRLERTETPLACARGV